MYNIHRKNAWWSRKRFHAIDGEVRKESDTGALCGRFNGHHIDLFDALYYNEYIQPIKRILNASIGSPAHLLCIDIRGGKEGEREGKRKKCIQTRFYTANPSYK